MAWETVAQATSLSELQSLIGELELPKGTRMKVSMDLKLPLGWAFDFIGAEWLAQGFVPDGMDLVDVRKDSSSSGIVELEADPAWLLAVIAFIKAHWLALTIAGLAIWLVVSMITITVKMPAIVQAPFWLLAGAAIGVVGLIMISKKAPT